VSGASLVAQEYEDLSRIEAAYNSDVLQLLGVNPAPGQLPYVAPGPAALSYGGGPQIPSAAQPAGYSRSATAQAPFGAFGTPLRQYGYQMFASNVTTFAPVDDMPVGPDYVVGPGDDLSISVWGPVDSTIVRTVDRNGRIVLPKVGDLRVWGMTFSETDRLIREQLARYFRGFQTSVTMGRLRTVRVHVVGEVCQPGVYTFSSLSTVTNALYGAGGPTKLGSLRNVRLLRNHHVVGTLDLYDFLQRGDRTRDFRLENGDTIFVPTIGDVATVAGEVKRPAIYEVRGNLRVADVIEMAGGVTPGSYLRRVQIVRAQPSAERVTIDVDMSRYYQKRDDEGNPPVQGGDLVLIHRSDPRIYNTVRVDGAVKYPGLYELKPTMRIGELLPADKLLPEAYTDRVEIARRRPDLTVEIVPVSLKKAWAGDPEANLQLRPLDEVTVRTEFRAARTVTLSGQVVRPGDYPIAEGERISSVIERAGGFTDKAFLTGAVFTRAALRKTEQEQLQNFVTLQEKAIMATAATTIIGAEKEEVLSQQAALQARRELLKSLAARVTVGRMVVRLDDPSRMRGTSDDIVLVDGDSVQIPEPPSSVLVIGAVRTSTSVLYKPGSDINYYVNRVGGFSKEADEKETHIVKADGSAIAHFAKVRTVEPGDTIMVPPKEEEKIRVLPTIRDVMSAIGSAMISFAAMAVLF
jgi:protein involved in polysaccharide export with SLBB domain